MIQRMRPLLAHSRMPIYAAIAMAVLASPALFTGRYVDDIMHEGVLSDSDAIKQHFGSPRTMFDFVSGEPDRHRYLIDSGLFPWWTYEGTKLSFWRPLTEFTHRIDFVLWRESDFLMHLHNIAWWFGAVVMAALLYRRLLGPGWVAGLAMLLYAIDDAAAMPVGWLANRNAVIAVAFAWMALLLHMRAREDKQPLLIALALLATLCAVLSNEGAVALGAYLFAYALTRDPSGFKRGFLWLLPYLGVVVAWRVVYKILGFGALNSHSYIDPASEPLRFLSAVVERAPILISGLWLGPPSDGYTFLTYSLRNVHWTFALLIAIGVIIIAITMYRRDRGSRFFIIGMLLSILPACSTFTSDRLLLFAGFGAMGLMARIVALAIEADRKWIVRAIVAVHVVIAAVMLPARIIGFAVVGSIVTTAALDVDLPDDVDEKTLVIASSPNPFFSAYLPVTRAAHGLSAPKYVRSLGPLLLLPPGTIEMRRINEYTLELTPDFGYPWMLVRDDDHPMPVGWSIEAPGFRVEVMSLTERGHPHTVRYTFDVPLEDDSLIWLRLTGPRFTAFEPPRIGAVRIFRP